MLAETDVISPSVPAASAGPSSRRSDDARNIYTDSEGETNCEDVASEPEAELSGPDWSSYEWSDASRG